MDIYQEVLKIMRLDGVDADYEAAIRAVADVILYPAKYTQNNKIAVISLETGSGKSSIVNVSLAMLALWDYESTGTLLLKERVVDCDETVKRINEYYREYGGERDIAAAYYADMFVTEYKAGARRYNRTKETDYRKTLSKYPILVITHQGFMRRIKRYGEFTYWISDRQARGIDGAGRINNRTRLIIDEHPNTVKIIRITAERLTALEKMVGGIGGDMFVPIYKACSEIRRRFFVNPRKVTQRGSREYVNQYWAKLGVKMTEKLDEFFFDKRGYDEYGETYVALCLFGDERGIGGIVNYSEKPEWRYVTVGLRINFFDEMFNTVILDGTARINSLYRNERFNMIDLPVTKTYANTTIRVCKELSGSKSELAGNEGIIDAVLGYIRDNKPHRCKGLIITLKEFEKAFIDKGLPRGFEINHFGNITGTNRYMDCSHLYLVGTLFWPDGAYKIAYHICNGGSLDKEQGVEVIDGARKFKDKDYRETANCIMAADLVQAINRVRCRKRENGDTPVTFVFMLNRDREVVELIQKCMPGVAVEYDNDFYKRLPQKDVKVTAADAVVGVVGNWGVHFDKHAVFKDEVLAAAGFGGLAKATKAAVWGNEQIKKLKTDGVIVVENKIVRYLG